MTSSLRVAMMRDPFGEWDPKQGDHHLDLQIEMNEWEALVLGVLEAPVWDEKSQAEDAQNYFERQAQRCEQALSAKGYAMLGRMWDNYRDAAYLPSEVRDLCEESLSVQTLTDNPDALEALRKLILACDEAQRLESGIRLLSD